jgi:hypothetical protein
LLILAPIEDMMVSILIEGSIFTSYKKSHHPLSTANQCFHFIEFYCYFPQPKKSNRFVIHPNSSIKLLHYNSIADMVQNAIIIHENYDYILLKSDDTISFSDCITNASNYLRIDVDSNFIDNLNFLNLYLSQFLVSTH